MNTFVKWGRTLSVLCMTGALVGGCIAIGGTDRYESKNPTLGRQLQDLKVARDTGAITPQEYENAKGKLLTDAH